jgi:uncharacterized membrane protein
MRAVQFRPYAHASLEVSRSFALSCKTPRAGPRVLSDTQAVTMGLQRHPKYEDVVTSAICRTAAPVRSSFHNLRSTVTSGASPHPHCSNVLPSTTMPNSTNSTLPYNPDLDPLHLYGYIPTQWICITILTLFSITTAIHVAQAVLVKPRLWWLLPTTAMCGTGEVIGWAGRLLDSKNPLNRNAFLQQIATTIIAPVFLTAAMYTILGLIIEIVGRQYSRIAPKTYLKIFVTLDVLALVVQAAGGAIASIADTDSLTNTGGHIMLAGIFLQMRPFPGRVSSADSVEGGSPSGEKWQMGTHKNGGVWLPRRLSLMILGLALSTIFVFLRTGYRTVELIGGWHGHIIRTQVFFNVLDAMPIILALYTLNVLSPVYLLRPAT